MTLTILLGDYGSGKTATAKYLAKQTGGVYLDVDILSQANKHYTNSDNSGLSLSDKLRDIMKPGLDYFMDGWPTGNYYGCVNKQTLGAEVRYIVCMVAPDILRSRQEKKKTITDTNLPRSYDEIKGITHLAASIALTYDSDPLFADTSTRPPTFWRKEDWFNRWMEINIYSNFKNSGEYQDVELRDMGVVGLSKSYKTWDRLEALVDFRGKSVIDYGCNYGYFSFKAEEAGANAVMGIDESQGILNIATSIAMVKKSRVTFVTSDLKSYKPKDADIILALNVLHHLKYDEAVLDLMFKNARMVVLEMPVKDRPLVSVVAKANKFMGPVIASSHRIGRCIVIYSKAKPVEIPRRYEYHPKRAAFLKWAYHTARIVIKFLHIPRTAITVKIKHYIWGRLK